MFDGPKKLHLALFHNRAFATPVTIYLQVDIVRCVPKTFI